MSRRHATHTDIRNVEEREEGELCEDEEKHEENSDLASVRFLLQDVIPDMQCRIQMLELVTATMALAIFIGGVSRII